MTPLMAVETAPRLAPSRAFTEVAAEISALHRMLLRGSWALLIALVCGFALKMPTAALWAMSGVLLAAAGTLAVARPALALTLLPALALLGPICRIQISAGLILHLGDVYLGILAIALAARALRQPMLSLGVYAIPLLALLLLAMASWLGSIDPPASFAAMIGLGQLVLVYVLTMAWVTNRSDALRMMSGWLGAVTLSSVLVIWSYANGEPLLLGTDADLRGSFASLIASGNSFYRATFFVGGFVFPLAVSIAGAVVAFLGANALGTVRRFALMVSLVINVLALVLMGNMSAMAGTVAGTAIGVAVSILDRRRAARSILFSAVVAGGAAVGVALLQSIMTEGQRFLMLARLNDSTSLRERFAVWHNVVRFLLETPGALLLGLGPDISIRRAGDPLLKQLFLGGGVQQAAVDSGYLYVALNFGLVALAVLMLAGADLVHRTGVAAIRRRDWMALLLCVGTGIWGIVAISQQHGISKPVFMIAQMAALAQVVTRSGRGDRAEDVG